MILSCLSRLIVSHSPSMSVTHLRPAVGSSLQRPCPLSATTFIFLTQNFPWAWYPFGNLVGISSRALAIWLKHSCLFLSPNLLRPPYPQTLVSLVSFSISGNSSTWAKNCRYRSGFFSFLSNPSTRSVVPSGFISSQSTTQVFTATSLLQGTVISGMNHWSSFLTGLLVSFLAPHRFLSHSRPREHVQS